MLNYFHWDSSPYHKDFMSEAPLPFGMTAAPELGLPTPEEGGKKTGFALLKEKQRLQKLRTDYPKYHYLVETVAMLARSIG